MKTIISVRAKMIISILAVILVTSLVNELMKKLEVMEETKVHSRLYFPSTVTLGSPSYLEGELDCESLVFSPQIRCSPYI